ncbi:hypothetical protein BJX70DRAFT_194778 [Aspergillus crustosus]
MQHITVILAMGCAQAVCRLYGRLFGTVAIMLILSLIMPLWMLYIALSPRPLQRTPDKHSNNTFLGQPQLLPTQVSHTRLGTGRYNYTVPHFLVGTPVGLHGRIGNVLSLDEPEAQSQSQSQSHGDSHQSRTQTAGPMQYLHPNLESWFTVHAHHHLHKGNDAVGLQGKLHQFLVSQGQDPSEWPHAYLVTMPQFLGYQRNLVCFWYLYSPARELTAMIMEVNNYWGQRKIAFSRLTGEAPLQVHPSPSQTTEFHSEIVIPTGQSACRFMHSNPRHLTYRGSWDKDMSISPFEKVEGSIALRFSDPLAANTPLQITITLLSPSGKPRLIGRVFCPQEQEPLNLLTASSWTLLRFLPYWTGVLVVTELLIIAAALRIRSRGAAFFAMPEVRRMNLPRDETDIERSLEPAFRAYLKHLVESSPAPVKLVYIPSKSHTLEAETFTSPSSSYKSTDDPDPDADPDAEPKPQSITLQVLTPEFYTSFPLYKNSITAFETESRALRLESDPDSRRLLIDNEEAFFALLASSESSCVQKTSSSSQFRLRLSLSLTTWLISYLRPPSPSPSPSPSSTQYTPENKGFFLDEFTTTTLPPTSQKTYFTALLSHLLSLKVAFGSHSLLGLYESLVYLGVMAGVSYWGFEVVWGGAWGWLVK